MFHAHYQIHLKLAIEPIREQKHKHQRAQMCGRSSEKQTLIPNYRQQSMKTSSVDKIILKPRWNSSPSHCNINLRLCFSSSKRSCFSCKLISFSFCGFVITFLYKILITKYDQMLLQWALTHHYTQFPNKNQLWCSSLYITALTTIIITYIISIRPSSLKQTKIYLFLCNNGKPHLGVMKLKYL